MAVEKLSIQSLLSLRLLRWIVGGGSSIAVKPNKDDDHRHPEERLVLVGNKIPTKKKKKEAPEQKAPEQKAPKQKAPEQKAPVRKIPAKKRPVQKIPPEDDCRLYREKDPSPRGKPAHMRFPEPPKTKTPSVDRAAKPEPKPQTSPAKKKKKSAMKKPPATAPRKPLGSVKQRSRPTSPVESLNISMARTDSPPPLPDDYPASVAEKSGSEKSATGW